MTRQHLELENTGPVSSVLRPVLRGYRPLWFFVCVLLVAGVAVAGCGGETGSQEIDGQVVVDETGSIAAGDSQDPNYGDLPYDAYSFEAKKFDRVRMEVAAEGFTPLLLLVEASSGAQLWEWQGEYSDDDALLYTIAGPGSYEARVYALEGGTGTYQLRVTLNE